MEVEPISHYIITSHAAFEMRRRAITEELVRQVLSNPGQRMEVRPGRVVLQSQIPLEGKIYLTRVFVDIDPHPAEVITAYRTSKISKYWREES